jgi:hypothetical protein
MIMLHAARYDVRVLYRVRMKPVKKKLNMQIVDGSRRLAWDLVSGYNFLFFFKVNRLAKKRNHLVNKR